MDVTDGVNLFGGQILDAISSSDDDNISSDSSIRSTASKQLIAQSTSIPACLLTIFLFQYLGIKILHVWGFVLIGSAFVLMACLFTELRDHNHDALFALYCFLLFTLSTGPNVTTFVLPSQSYPKEVRASFNGISAALGKLGAVFGAYIYGSVAAATSYVVVMVICAILAFFGAFISYIWFPEADSVYMKINEEDEKEQI
jgi:MFS transporter, PHS family, inorganic phosphate transporter